MKSVIFKKSIIAITIITVITAINIKEVYANAPDIVGGVYSSTGAPIPGATVVWRDNRGAIRTAGTDGNGRFYFVSWQNSGNGSGFGCLESPHTWSVSGLSCSSITTSFGNIGAQLDIGNITCGPPPPPPPTSTPVPSPTPTITPTPMPVCGGPCNFINTNCPLDCAICTPNKEGKNVCSKTHTETNGTPTSQGPNANFLSTLYSYKDFPSPTISFMQLKLGNFR